MWMGYPSPPLSPPPEGARDQRPRYILSSEQTHICENITFRCTSYAGGKNSERKHECHRMYLVFILNGSAKLNARCPSWMTHSNVKKSRKTKTWYQSPSFVLFIDNRDFFLQKSWTEFLEFSQNLLSSIYKNLKYFGKRRIPISRVRY